MSEGLAQGLFVAARVGFERATVQTQGTESTMPHKFANSCAFVEGAGNRVD